MNCEEMSKYIEYVADRLLTMFGLETHFKTENPFDWMETISIQGKTNFLKNEWVNIPMRVIRMEIVQKMLILHVRIFKNIQGRFGLTFSIGFDIRN